MVRRFVTGLSVIVPNLEVSCGTELDIRYETPIIHLLPGCRLRVCIRFYWHERMIEGSSVYLPHRRHGLISLQADSRGEFSSPGAFFMVNDAAGLFRFRVFSRHEERLIVNPGPCDKIDIPRILTIGGEDESRTVRKKRSDDLIETRQYYPGDDVRRINWKTFAHLGELFIRQGEELPDPDSHLTVIPDFSGVSDITADPNDLGLYLDHLVSVLVGIIEHMRRFGVSIDVVLPDGSTVDGSSNNFLPGMWWEDGDLNLPTNGGSTSYLLVSSAFSNRAEKICRQISRTGRPLGIIVPLPSEPPPVERRGRLAWMIFTGPEPEVRAVQRFKAEAENLVLRLKAENGGADAIIV